MIYDKGVPCFFCSLSARLRSCHRRVVSLRVRLVRSAAHAGEQVLMLGRISTRAVGMNLAQILQDFLLMGGSLIHPKKKAIKSIDFRSRCEISSLYPPRADKIEQTK